MGPRPHPGAWGRGPILAPAVAESGYHRHMAGLDELLTLERDATVLALRTLPGQGTFRFHEADYDADEDRLRLVAGPDAAGYTELTPEGHLLRVTVPDHRIRSLELVGVRRALATHGRVTVTLAPDQVATLFADDIAHLLTARPRGGRFSRS